MDDPAALTMPLPPKTLRWGGSRYQSDEAYLRSAQEIARRVIAECKLSRESRVLDIGCGQGRLLRGLVGELGSVRRYLGIDVHLPSIEWLSREVKLDFAEFRHVDFMNERYNPASDNRQRPEVRELFDSVVLISVFSHMRLDDVSAYLALIEQSMDREGSAFLTVFAEDDVPLEEENPEGYIAPSKGPLHRVRLNRQNFERMVRAAGLGVSTFRHAVHDGQSLYVLSRRPRV